MNRRPVEAVRLSRFALVWLMVAGGLLRFYRIGREGLWLDEAFSAWMAAQPLTDMLVWLVKIDQHPPLYYTLLHLWLNFGDSAPLLRALSALMGMLTIPVIYWLGYLLDGVRLGLLAALLLTISPFHMRFAQEARMYTLLTLNVALATGALLYLLTDHRARIVPLGRQLAQCFRRSSAFTPSECTLATDLAWAGYLLFTLAALLTHNTAIFYPVAANLFVLGFIGWHHFRPQSGRFQPTSLQNWLIAQLILFLLWSPWLPAFITQSVGVDREFWMSTPHLGDILWALKNFFSAFLPDHAAGGNLIWVGYGLLTLLGLVHFRAEPTRAALLLFLFLTPIVGELLVSLRRPIFSYHTLIWASIPLYLLLAAGLRLLRWRVLIMAGTLWLVALNLISLNEYYTTFRKEEWDEAAHYVAEHAQGNDLILFNATWVQIPFDFYFHDYHRPVLEHGVPVDLFDRGVLEPKMTAADLPRLHDLISGHDRIWLVYSHDWYTDPQAIVRTTLSEALTLIDEREFFGLKLYLYSAR